MSEIREEKEIVGRLFTGGREYELLSLEPAERFALPTYMRNGALSFYVRNAFGYAVYIVVKGDFIIEPYPVAVYKDVTFVVEEAEQEKVSLYVPLSDSVE